MIEEDQPSPLVRQAERQLRRFPKHPNPLQAPGIALSLLRAWVVDPENEGFGPNYAEALKEYALSRNVYSLKVQLGDLRRLEYEDPATLQGEYRAAP